jgi:hypothetical protein
LSPKNDTAPPLLAPLSTTASHLPWYYTFLVILAVLAILAEIALVFIYCRKHIYPEPVILPKDRKACKGVISMQIAFHEISGLSYENNHKGISTMVTLSNEEE